MWEAQTNFQMGLFLQMRSQIYFFISVWALSHNPKATTVSRQALWVKKALKKASQPQPAGILLTCLQHFWRDVLIKYIFSNCSPSSVSHFLFSLMEIDVGCPLCKVLLASSGSYTCKILWIIIDLFPSCDGKLLPAAPPCSVLVMSHTGTPLELLMQYCS